MSKRDNIRENSKGSSTFLDTNIARGTVTEHHEKLLGAKVPEDYFKASKRSIMEAVKQEEVSQPKVIKLRPRYRYAVAASVAVLISLAIWFQSTGSISPNELNELADDALLNSLLVDDANISSFTDNILVDEVLVKAEISEQNIENVFINSLFVEDSLLDDYMGNSLLENVIL